VLSHCPNCPKCPGVPPVPTVPKSLFGTLNSLLLLSLGHLFSSSDVFSGGFPADLPHFKIFFGWFWAFSGTFDAVFGRFLDALGGLWTLSGQFLDDPNFCMGPI